jgi:membrane protease YdiL (CAAX protease family)
MAFVFIVSLLNGGSEADVLNLYARHMADVYLASSLLFAGCLIAALLVYRRIKRSHFTDFLLKPGTEKLSLFLLGSFRLGITMNLGLSNLISLLPVPEQWVADNSESVNAFAQSNLWIMLLAQSVAAPLVEELIFRGVLYHSLRRAPVAVNRKLCVAISAVVVSGVFGWIHGNILQALYCFVFSLVLIWLVETTGSVWGAVVTHMGFNSPWVLMILIGQWYDRTAFLLNSILFLAVSAILLILTLWAGRSKGRSGETY